MNDSDNLSRFELAFNRYLSFRSFAKKVSYPAVESPVLPVEWKPFYVKDLQQTSSVRFFDGANPEIMRLKDQFARSRFDTYAKLVSNFYEADCGCEGEVSDEA